MSPLARAWNWCLTHRTRIALILAVAWAIGLGVVAFTSHRAAARPVLDAYDYTTFEPAEPLPNDKLEAARSRYRLNPRYLAVQELKLQPTFDWELLLVHLAIPLACVWGLWALAGAVERKDERKRYPTDMDEILWLRLQKHLSKLSSEDRPRDDLRNLLNAFRYWHNAGLSDWELLPHDFPDASTTREFFEKWTKRDDLKALFIDLGVVRKEISGKDGHAPARVDEPVGSRSLPAR